MPEVVEGMTPQVPDGGVVDFLVTAELPKMLGAVHLEADRYLAQRLSQHRQLHSIDFLFQSTASTKSLVHPDSAALPDSIDSCRLALNLRATSAEIKQIKSRKKKKTPEEEISAEAVDPLKVLEDKVAVMKFDMFKDYKAKLDEIHALLDHVNAAKSVHETRVKKQVEETQAKFGSSLQALGLPMVRLPIKIDESLMKRSGLISVDGFGGSESSETHVQKEDSGNTATADTAFIDYLDREIGGLLEADVDPFQHVTLSQTVDDDSAQDAFVPAFSKSRQTEINRKLMKKLQARLDYLKNPRFAKTAASEKGTSPTVVNNYLIEPASVVFDDFRAGHSYTKRFTITNASDRSRRFRLVQPTASSCADFSVECCEFPTATHALISPGLSCTYQVTFYPQSLHNYEDKVLIAAESGEMIEVPLYGHRRIPVLGLPAELDFGHGRAGFTNVRKFRFKNTGGRGNAVIVTADTAVDTAESYLGVHREEYQNRGTISVGRFEIGPTYLSVEEDEEVELTLHFRPEPLEQGVFEGSREQAAFLVYFDNAQTIPVTVFATPQKPQIIVRDLKGVDAYGTSMHDLFQPNEELAEHIDFGTQNPHGYTRKTLVLRNDSQLNLPYRWTTVNGFTVQQADKGDTTVDTGAGNRDPAEKAFTIFPGRGTLKAQQEISFEIMFAPVFQQRYLSLAHLTLANGSDEFYRSPERAQIEEYCAASLRLTGTCVPYQVDFYPATVILPPVMDLHTNLKHPVNITNTSSYTATYHCEVELSNDIVATVTVENASGQIPQCACAHLHLIVYAKALGKMNGKLHCYIQNGAHTSFSFEFEVRLPENLVVFDPPFLDLGLMTPGTKSSALLPLVNRSDRDLRFILRLRDASSARDVQLDPKHGMLRAGERKTVRLLFKSNTVQHFRDLIECVACVQSDHGAHVTHQILAVCDLSARVVTRRAAFGQSRIEMGTCYVGVPKTIKVQLRNLTQLPTTFTLCDHDMADTDFEVTFEPKHGVLKGGECVEVAVTFLAGSMQTVQDLLLLAHVAGMPEDKGFLGLLLSADVRNFAYEYSVDSKMITMMEDNSEKSDGAAIMVPRNMPSTDDTPRLDFGMDCPIFGRRIRTITITNQSGIRTPFRVTFDRYACPSEQDLAVQRARKNVPSALEGNTGIGFQSSSGQRYTALRTNSRTFTIENMTYLTRGNGVAFRSVPESGFLEPFESKELQVVAYADLWGVFDDVWQLEIGGDVDRHRVSIPIHMGVVGSPVRFSGHSVINNDATTNPMINFGVRIREEDPTLAPLLQVSKSVVVQNLSPKTVRIDWRAFEYKQQWEEERAVRLDVHMGEYQTTGAVKVELAYGDHALVQGRSPFKVEPAFVDVPAHGEKQIMVTFGHRLAGEFDGFLLGELAYWAAPRKLVPAKIGDAIETGDTDAHNWGRTREAGPIVLDLTGRIIDPDLVLNSGKSQIHLRCVETTGTSSTRTCRKSVSLINPTDTQINFDLATTAPFHLHVKTAKHPCGFYRLNPNQEFRVEVGVEGAEAMDQAICMGRGGLEIRFNNGSMKTIPMALSSGL